MHLGVPKFYSPIYDRAPPTSKSVAFSPFSGVLDLLSALRSIRSRTLSVPGLHLSPSDQSEYCVTLLTGRFCDVGLVGLY